MTVNTDINYDVFGSGEEPVDESLLENVTEIHRNLLRGMMQAGYYQDGLYLAKFLRDDLTVNLELLELAVTIIVVSLESNRSLDVTLKLKGLDDYYFRRGVLGNPDKQREERIFMLGFITSVAAEASRRDTLEVKYV